MSVEDTASQSSVILSMTEKTHFRVHDSQGSVETLVRSGGITNYHWTAYSFSNMYAKNYQNRLMCIEVIVCNVSVIFWDTVYIHTLYTDIYKYLVMSLILNFTMAMIL